MAVFAYENGKLIPAQPIDLSMSRLGDGALVALRERAVDLIEAPLFPVAWVTEPMPSGSRDCLICLDPTGQIVTVDVLARLSSDELIAALAATGRHADNSTERLASMYAAGQEAFSADWRSFLDACPPSSRPGPRLFLIVLGIEEEVRPAVDALAGAGVDVRVASVIGSGAQVFVSLEAIRPRITALSRVLGVARRRVEVEDGTRSARWETNVAGTAEGDAAVAVAQAEGFGPGYVDVEVVRAADSRPGRRDDAVAQGPGAQSAAAGAAARAEADAGAVQETEGEQVAAAQQDAGAVNQEAAEALADASAGQDSQGKETIEIHAEGQGGAQAPRPAARHASRRGGAGVRSARFGAHAPEPAEVDPAAVAAFAVPEDDAAASRRRSARLKDMLAADKRALEAEAAVANGQVPAQDGAEAQDGTQAGTQSAPAAEPSQAVQAAAAAQPAAQEARNAQQAAAEGQEAEQQADAAVQTLSTFDIASRPPVAKQAAEPEVPMTRAPESAASVDSAISALTPPLPGMSRRERRRRQAEEVASRARQEEAREAAAREAEAPAAPANAEAPAPSVDAAAEPTAGASQGAAHAGQGAAHAARTAPAASAEKAAPAAHAAAAAHAAGAARLARASHAARVAPVQLAEDSGPVTEVIHPVRRPKRRRAHATAQPQAGAQARAAAPASSQAQAQHAARTQAATQAPAHAQGQPGIQAAQDAQAPALRREAATTYEQSRAARLRAEQLLWESSAPIHEGRPEPQLISESTASSASSDAVEDAAERDYLSPSGRLAQIAKRNSTPLSLTWKSQRLGINLRAQVMPWGTIVLSNGAAYSDPTAAAREQSGLADADGWKVWKAEDGRSLEEL